MQLTKIYVANFGKLQDVSFQCDGGINEICAGNGFGKTTLATFIKVMFYGFTGNGHSISTNERAKYRPWQGGKYGGNIEFVANGKSFKLERYFGKTEKDDAVHLYDLTTNNVQNVHNLGEELFGIDADGFSKSIFFAENKTFNYGNTSLQAKLSASIESCADLNDFENATKLLDTKRKIYINKNGKIPKLEQSLLKINGEIENCKASSELVQKYQLSLNSLTAQINTLEERKEKIENYLQSNQRQLELIAKKEHLQSIEKDIYEINLKLNEYKAFFAKHLPTKEELDKMYLLESEVRAINEKYNSYLPDDAYLFYKVNEQKFAQISAKNIEKSIEIAINGQSNHKNGNYIFLILGVFFLIAGGVLFAVNTIFACLALVISLVLVAMQFLRKDKNHLSVKEQIKEQLPNIDFDNGAILQQLYALKGEFDRWSQLNVLFEQTKDEILNLEKFKQEKNDKLQYFLINYPKEENTQLALQKIKTNFENYNYLKMQLEQKVSVKDSFVQSNKFVDQNFANLQNENIDKELKDCKVRLAELNSSVLEIKQKLFIEQEKLACKQEYERNKDAVILQLNEAQEEYDAIIKTMEFLQKAKDNLNSRYLLPMQQEYNGLIKQLNLPLVKESKINLDFDVLVEYDSELKKFDSLSQGYKSILDFCVRLALIKCLYQNEKPFLIIDDAFMSLDDDNFDKLKQVLRSFSKDYQIIYFICAKERSLNVA